MQMQQTQTRRVTVVDLEAEATSFARQNRGQATTGLYVTNSTAKVTKERAFAQLLEERPEIYAAYRDQHNAAPLLAQLKAAGVLS
jgi:hypothetical protein